MKALTVRQPWAWLIFHGKNVDNRSNWRYTYTGPLAIHAGQRLADDISLAYQLMNVAGIEPLMLGAPRSPVEATMSALIGSVDLLTPHWWEDCQKPDGTLCSPWAFVGRWHLPLRRPQVFRAPIECPGRQGLWDAPKGTLAAVQAVR